MAQLSIENRKALKDLKNKLHEKYEDVLMNEIFDVIADIMVENIQEHVYGVYEPERYIRRSDGTPDRGHGLGAKSNIVCELRGRRQNKNTKTLFVWNVAKLNPRNNPKQKFDPSVRTEDSKSLLQGLIIEGWSDPDSKAWKKPRPFMEKAQKALESPEGQKRVQEALAKGLKRHRTKN